jgi:hypothetical protein
MRCILLSLPKPFHFPSRKPGSVPGLCDDCARPLPNCPSAHTSIRELVWMKPLCSHSPASNLSRPATFQIPFWPACRLVCYRLAVHLSCTALHHTARRCPPFLSLSLHLPSRAAPQRPRARLPVHVVSTIIPKRNRLGAAVPVPEQQARRQSNTRPAIRAMSPLQ